MAFFGVSLEVIDQIFPHPNADRLSIYKMKDLDFEVVAGLGEFNIGQKVLYFPVDSVIPQEILQKLGLEGKLKGKDKNRVGMIKLRNIFSKGLITTTSLLDGAVFQTNVSPNVKKGWTVQDPKEKEMLSAEITAFLGVTKYDPPVSAIKGGIHAGDCSGRLPEGLGFYNIEGCDRYPDVAKNLLYREVTVTEKLEGSCCSVCFYRQENKLYVNMHNNSVLPNADIIEPPYWQMAKNCGHIDLVNKLNEQCKHYVAIFSEAIGPDVQGNMYKLKQNKIVAYDIKIDGRFVCKDVFFKLAKGIETVPVLCRHTRLMDFLDGKTIQEAANGKSELYDVLREGIVITPEQEAYCEALHGRTVLKQHSPRYLAGER